MDTRIAGTIIWRPQRANERVGDDRITFTLVREIEGDEVVCISSLEFDRTGFKLGLGDRVALSGDWVIDNSSGGVAGFLFDRAEKLDGGWRGR